MTKEQRQMIEYTTEEVKYGVTELEAINILNGKCISDYVEKYNRIKNLTINKQEFSHPLQVVR